MRILHSIILIYISCIFYNVSSLAIVNEACVDNTIVGANTTDCRRVTNEAVRKFKSIDYSVINTELPQFKQYKCSSKKFKKAKKVNLESNKDAKKFRTVLNNGFKGEANFAGHFIIVSHGCGTMCQQHWVIDQKDGTIKDCLQTSIGAEFKNDSNLLILNPIVPSMKDDIKYYNKESDIEYPLWKGEKSVYLTWDNNKFNTIKEIDIYEYLLNN